MQNQEKTAEFPGTQWRCVELGKPNSHGATDMKEGNEPFNWWACVNE